MDWMTNPTQIAGVVLIASVAVYAAWSALPKRSATKPSGDFLAAAQVQLDAYHAAVAKIEKLEGELSQIRAVVAPVEVTE
jgi:hypothetical protein